MISPIICATSLDPWITHRLLDIVHADNKLYLVFEFLDVDLKRYMENGNHTGKPISLAITKVSRSKPSPCSIRSLPIHEQLLRVFNIPPHSLSRPCVFRTRTRLGSIDSHVPSFTTHPFSFRNSQNSSPLAFYIAIPTESYIETSSLRTCSSIKPTTSSWLISDLRGRLAFPCEPTLTRFVGSLNTPARLTRRNVLGCNSLVSGT